MTNVKHNRRPRGSIYRRLDSPFLWISYSVNARKFRENTKLTNERQARRLLDRRLGEVADGRFVGLDVRKTTMQELWKLVERNYEIKARKSGSTLAQRWEKHVKPFFGFLKANQVTSDLVGRYIDSRLEAGARPATINRELAIVSRMYSLGLKERKVLERPNIPKLSENNRRTGFVDNVERVRLAAACAKEGLWMRAWFECAVTLGWRVSELLNLRVKQVDLSEGSLRLNPGETKNGEGRLAFLTDAGSILIRECIRGKPSDDFVFTRKDGKPVRNFRAAWKKATEAAGVPALLVHDLRRTGIRNMIRSGIPQSVAMQISGHKTLSVFKRYDIVDESDLRSAAKRMSHGTTAVTQLGHVSVTMTPSQTSQALGLAN